MTGLSGQCLWSYGSEFQYGVRIEPARESRAKAMSRLAFAGIAGFSACGCQKCTRRSVDMSVAVQRGTEAEPEPS